MPVWVATCLLHEHAGTNVALAWELDPLPDEVWDGCDVTVGFDMTASSAGTAPDRTARRRIELGRRMGDAPRGCARSGLLAPSTSSRRCWASNLEQCGPSRPMSAADSVPRAVGAAIPEDVAVAWAAREFEPTDSLGADPLGGLAGDGPRSGVSSPCSHRRQSRRQDRRLLSRCAAGQRRVSGHGHQRHEQICATAALACTTSRTPPCAAHPW